MNAVSKRFAHRATEYDTPMLLARKGNKVKPSLKPKVNWKRTWDFDIATLLQSNIDETFEEMLPSSPMDATVKSLRSPQFTKDEKATIDSVDESQVRTLIVIGSPTSAGKNAHRKGDKDKQFCTSNVHEEHPDFNVHEEQPDFSALHTLADCAATFGRTTETLTPIIAKSETHSDGAISTLKLDFCNSLIIRARRSRLQRRRRQTWGNVLLLNTSALTKALTLKNLRENPDASLKVQGSNIGVVSAPPLNPMPVAKSMSRVRRFKGINFYKRIGRWTTHIWAEGKQFYIGSYSSASEAASAYDKASLKHFGADAQLNYDWNDYVEDIDEMAGLTPKAYRSLLQNRANEGSSQFKIAEGVTVCPKGWFEVRLRDRAPPRKWQFLGKFDNLEDAERCYKVNLRLGG